MVLASRNIGKGGAGLPQVKKQHLKEKPGGVDPLHQRCTWIGANIFKNKMAIDLEAISALRLINIDRAFDMLRELEAKGSSITHPSGYLKAAIKREFENASGASRFMQMGGLARGFGGGGGGGFGGARGSRARAPMPNEDPHTCLHKRCTWLGANLFGDKMAISQEAIEMLASINFPDAMEICSNLEEAAPKVTNPSGYLKASVKRYLGGAGPFANNVGQPPSGNNFDTLHKRCTWIGSNIFGSKVAIDMEAIALLNRLEFEDAMDLLSQLEQSADKVSDPSGYIKAAIKRALPQLSAAGSKGAGGTPWDHRLHKRCTWLGANVFGDKLAIDTEAIEALSSIDFDDAMELTKMLEDAGPNIDDPSGYLKASVKGLKEG